MSVYSLKTGDSITNLHLMRHCYTVSKVLKVDRKKYYSRLTKADKGDLKPFIDYTARSVERSLDPYPDTFKQGPGYVPLSQAAEDTPTPRNTSASSPAREGSTP